MDKSTLIKSQNRLVVQLLWIAGILAFTNNLLSVRDPIAGVLILGVIGGLALVMSYLVYTNRMTHSVKYLALAGIHITVFIFIEFTPGILSYLAIYTGLFIIGIYQETQIITMAGMLSVGLSTYAHLLHKDLIFHERYHDLWSMASLNFLIILACSLLILQSQFGYRVQRDLDKKE